MKHPVRNRTGDIVGYVVELDAGWLGEDLDGTPTTGEIHDSREHASLSVRMHMMTEARRKFVSKASRRPLRTDHTDRKDYD